MKLRIYDKKYENKSLNINNILVKFTDGIADVSDVFGMELIKDHPNLFKKPDEVREKTEKEDIQHKLKNYEELERQLVSAKIENKKLIERNQILLSDIDNWKTVYIELKNKINAKEGELEECTMLEEMSLIQLKKKAKSLNIDLNEIKRKTRKSDWIEAIKKHG